MTTLPTTTPIRLPRPAGAAPLALPSSLGGSSGPSVTMTGSDALRVIRTNFWWIFIVVAIAAVLGYVMNVYLLRYYASYTASGFTQINPPMNMSLLSSAPISQDISTLAIDQRTQAALLKQEALFIQVLQDPNSEIRKTQWWLSYNNNVFKAKEDLLKNFSADAIADSRLIQIRMSNSDPKSCKTIVEEIVNKHIDNQKVISQNKQLDRSVMLNNLKNRYQFHKDDITRDLREKALQLSVDGAGVPGGRIGAKDVELENLMQSQFQLTHNRDEAVAARDAAIAQLQAGQDLPGISEALARDPEVGILRQEVMSLEEQLDALPELGTANRLRLNFQKRRDDAQRKLDDATATVRARETADYIEKLKSMADQTEAQAKAMDDRITVAKQDLGALTNSMNQYLTLKDDEQATVELIKQVNNQLDQITDMTNANGSTVQWATHPEVPDTPSFPRLPWTMTLAIIVGLGLSMGIAFARELLDTSVRSPRDIQRVGQLNLLGIIPHEDDDTQAQGAPLPTVIFQAPHSMLAEQFRQVRSRLQHATSLDSTRSMMVTSPSPGDGKTVVACNLAAGLALNGRRILLVDANFRRPELHKIFGLPSDQGFSAALNSIDNFAAAVCQTQVPNLDVLPAGPRPTNSTELIESQLLIDFIERALEEYDHVIFDSGPFLFVSESVALAPRVDGVVTVVRARTNSRGLLQRLRDDLRKTKAEHLGIVLNAVRAQAGGYYNRNMKAYYAYQNGAE